MGGHRADDPKIVIDPSRPGPSCTYAKLSLTIWLWAAYSMATHSNGISAFQLRKQLGLGSYKTARALCAKLRRAMVDPDRNALSDLVEIAEPNPDAIAVWGHMRPIRLNIKAWEKLSNNWIFAKIRRELNEICVVRDFLINGSDIRTI